MYIPLSIAKLDWQNHDSDINGNQSNNQTIGRTNCNCFWERYIIAMKFAEYITAF